MVSFEGRSLHSSENGKAFLLKLPVFHPSNVFDS